MILIDYSNILYTSVQILEAPDNRKYVGEVTPDKIRKGFLAKIREIRRLFPSSQYGEMVICTDNKGDYWRKKEFPFYKSKRKEYRDASKTDWEMVFATADALRVELRETFGYRVVDVPGAEADDAIAVLVKLNNQKETDCFDLLDSKTESCIIVSSDKDFKQLHTYKEVKQWAPYDKEWITCSNPKAFLKEMIIRGDSGDSIPNILSPEDSFVIKKRQKSVYQEDLINWLEQEPEAFCSPEQLARYRKNEKLIDLKNIPQNIESKILENYNSQNQNTRQPLMPYFIAHRLDTLLENIGDF